MSAADKWLMSQDYAAIISATLAALFVVSIVELATTGLGPQSAKNRFREMYCVEIDEYMQALQEGRDVESATAQKLKPLLEHCGRCTRAVVTLARLHMILIAVTMLILLAALALVVKWSAGGALPEWITPPGLARRSFQIAGLSMGLLAISYLVRSLAEQIMDAEEQRMNVMRKYGISSLSEHKALLRRWKRDARPPVF
ncbi:hypothetical protein KUF83_28875 [Streptomyces sp. BV286]|uniref:hypothetical protein n=1 Tax=unclassified Streptomyces TaxID=2593676 RepID=UPI001C2F0CBD|nr:hypothetical protein [Streptomyces sp. BV286]MBV1940554.1 hypothetical protein [Streptomyces sp. BV286]